MSRTKTVNKSLVTKFARFALTGLLLTGVHTILAAAFIELVSALPPIANGLAFASATVLSYLINTHWSFSAKLSRSTFRKFLIVSVFGFVLAMLVSWLMQLAGYHYLLGILAVALCVPPVTFLLHNFWTYKTP